MNSNEVRQQWAERSGEYSPTYYAHYGPNATSQSVRERLDEVVGHDAAVLELGCSAGRHLAHLRERGYENLFGIDINDEAFEVMADAYPDLADCGTFYADAIENVLPEFEAGRFDAVYSVETLQHIHPDDEWVFGEVARITEDLLVTVENEGGDGEEASGASEGTDSTRDVNYVNDDFPLYYRDWKRVFTERGFAEVDAESTKRDTLRTFRPESAVASTETTER